MRITKWGEYGIHCAVALARHAAKGKSPVRAAEIAEELSIDLDYTQQILQRLRKGDVIRSVRGPQGGYQLCRDPEQITLTHVLKAAEGETFEIICVNKPLDSLQCAPNTNCFLKPVWYELRDHIEAFLSSHTIAAMAERTQETGFFPSPELTMIQPRA